MEARKEVEDNLMLKDIEWCMEMISSNKLYDPLITFKRNEDENFGDTNKNEVVKWIEHYSKANEESKHEKHGSLSVPSHGPGDKRSRRHSSFNKNNINLNMSYANLSAIPANVFKKSMKINELIFKKGL